MTLRICLFVLAAIPACCQSSVPPVWIQSLPERAGRVYALGTATIGASEAKALEQAAQNARFEVIARLRVRVQGSTTVSATQTTHRSSGGAAVGSSQQQVRQEGSTSIQAIDLPGLVVEERFADRRTGAVYALAYLDVEAAAGDLASQIEAIREEEAALKQEGAPRELRPTIARLQRFRGLVAQCEALENQAALLIPAGVKASVRSGIQALGQGLSREAASVQKGLTMGARVEGGDLGQDILAVLRNAAIRQGFLWNPSQARLFLVVDLRARKQGVDIRRRVWWDFDQSRPDFVVARAMIRVGIADVKGNQQDSFDLSLKGVGTDSFTAEQALLRELKRELPNKFQIFLNELMD